MLTLTPEDRGGAGRWGGHLQVNSYLTQVPCALYTAKLLWLISSSFIHCSIKTNVRVENIQIFRELNWVSLSMMYACFQWFLHILYKERKGGAWQPCPEQKCYHWVSTSTRPTAIHCPVFLSVRKWAPLSWPSNRYMHIFLCILVSWILSPLVNPRRVKSHTQHKSVMGSLPGLFQLPCYISPCAVYIHSLLSVLQTHTDLDRLTCM